MAAAHRLYRVFSHDVTAAILVSQNNETAAVFVSQTNPVGVKLFSYTSAFFCSINLHRSWPREWKHSIQTLPREWKWLEVIAWNSGPVQRSLEGRDWACVNWKRAPQMRISPKTFVHDCNLSESYNARNARSRILWLVEFFRICFRLQQPSFHLIVGPFFRHMVI